MPPIIVLAAGAFAAGVAKAFGFLLQPLEPKAGAAVS